MTVRTIIGGLVLSAVLLVPAGLAAERPDDRAGPIGIGGVAEPTLVSPVPSGTVDMIVARLDAGLDVYGNEIGAVRPDDRADRFTPGAAPTPASTPTAEPWIDWSDPLVVGALAALIAAVAMAAIVAYLRRGGPGMRGTPGAPTPSH